MPNNVDYELWGIEDEIMLSLKDKDEILNIGDRQPVMKEIFILLAKDFLKSIKTLYEIQKKIWRQILK